MCGELLARGHARSGDPAGIAGYLGVNIFGSFCGPLAFGFLADRIGRRPSFMIFLILQALNVVAYTQMSIGPTTTVILGFFLGAFQGGLASGLMPTFSELFPTEIRATGAGFALSAGRGFGSFVPAAVGWFSTSMPPPLASCGHTWSMSTPTTPRPPRNSTPIAAGRCRR